MGWMRLCRRCGRTSRELSAVIASQRVGARRRPMTGSAKQSISPRVLKDGLLRRFAPCNDADRAGTEVHTLSTPHHSAMNSAVALVDFRSDSSSTYSLKPCIAAPVAPKHRLGML